MTQFAESQTVERMLDARRRERMTGGRPMQCKVCWFIYDPAEGCPETQTPPGTPFEDLPGWWCCPQCGSPAETFLVLDEGVEAASEEKR